MVTGPSSTNRSVNAVEPAWVEEARRKASSREFRTRAMLHCFARARNYGHLISRRDAIGLTIDFARVDLLKTCIPHGVTATHTAMQSVVKSAAINVITSDLRIFAWASDTGRLWLSPEEADGLVDRFMLWWVSECGQAASAALDGQLTERQRCIREIRAPLVEETTPSLHEVSAKLKAGYRAHQQSAGMNHESGSGAVPSVVSAMWMLQKDPQRLASMINRTRHGKVTFHALRLRDLMGDRRRADDVREVASDDATIEAASAPKQVDPESEVVAAAEASEGASAARELCAYLAERAAACAPGSAGQIVLTQVAALHTASLSTRELARRTGLPRTTIQSVLEQEWKRLRSNPRFRSFAQHVG